MKSPIWPEFELIWDFMGVLVTCKFEEDLIKSEGAILQLDNIFSIISLIGKFFITQGEQLWIELYDLARNQTCLRFYDCLCYLQVWRRSNENKVIILRTTFSPIKSMGAIIKALKAK